MINRIKTELKLLRYSYQFGLFSVLGIFMFVMGWLFLIFDEEGYRLGIFYILMSAMFTVQEAHILEASTLIASSPKKKELVVNLPNKVSAFFTIVNYILYVILTYYKQNGSEAYEILCSRRLLLYAVEACIFLLYMGTAFKRFVESTIAFTIAFFAMYLLGDIVVKNINLSFHHGIIVSSLMILVGILLSNLCRKLLYRLPLQKISVGKQLRKYM
ncbi:hypothetical protein [Anaerosporobacter faecicola]|uniref:hypothetical protein n=1 Tax=Anaerosporobacter faecicola TaxID=2718714 RepID=UPI0014390098|nr:hypothetical protein [Anaerosporobacter faecicola]